jgi:predicted NBD/HSP70 family sugar kinase
MADQRGRNVRDVRRSNRSLLLRQLYFQPQASRLELSRTTGLSAASVSSVIAELIDAGVVVESGSVESEGGRPRIRLEVAASRFQVIGVDVGETRVRVERFDLALTELARAEIPVTPGRYEPDGVVSGIAAGLAAVGGPAPGAGTELLGIGIGVPGIVVGPPESVVHCQTIGWDAVPLEALLREVTDLPLFIDNGANTLGQAEMWFGAGRGASDTLFLLIGSGIGASVTVDGVAYRGSSTSAGEWGHITAAIGGRLCRCGARGCLEAYIGAESVIARYAEATGGAPDLADVADEESALLRILAAASQTSQDANSQGTTSQDTASQTTSSQNAASLRTEAARAVLDETALHLGVSIGNLVNLFNPERIIIGGWAGLLMAPELLPRVHEVAREHALRYPFGKATIELGRLGADAVARGAATLPVARFLNTAGAPVRGAG